MEDGRNGRADGEVPEAPPKRLGTAGMANYKPTERILRNAISNIEVLSWRELIDTVKGDPLERGYNRIGPLQKRCPLNVECRWG